MTAPITTVTGTPTRTGRTTRTAGSIRRTRCAGSTRSPPSSRVSTPDNADVYAANAAEARRALEALVVRTESSLVPVRGRGFVVFHDSIRYFEERFGVAAVAALSPSDASDASPSRVHRVRTAIEQLDVGCVFTEPQLDARRARVLVDGMDGVRLGVVDPLGAGIEPGAALYEGLVDGVTRSLVDCLGNSSGSDG